ncbi:MAG: cyclic nucleotide-binding domain-containing protein, partial [Phormidesmis sp. CAN_BIN36]|nr:cyclic nucleotide-binding domain-containing protein [Phormidesmis sp. CAN_BIN36]
FGTGLLLFSATVVSAIVTAFSAYPAIVGTVSEPSIPVLSLVARQILDQMPNASFEEKLLTLTATIVINAVAGGIIFTLLGRFKLGGFVRYIPYPIVGGFLAGTGVLLVQGALHSIEGLDLHHLTLSAFVEPNVLLQWVPGLIFAIVMFAVPQLIEHFLVIPGILAGAVILFYVALAVTGTSIEQAVDRSLLLQPLPPSGIYRFETIPALTQANWSVVVQQLPSLAALWLVESIALLLNASGIELAASRDLDLNHELKVAGVASIASGLGGGIGGFASSGENTLSHHLGGTRRIVGWTITGICLAMLLGGASLLSFFPKFILVGIPLLLALEFFYEWLYQAWFKFSRSDYAIIVLIVVVTGTVGYLPGIGVGLIAAIVLFVVNYSQLSVSKRVGSGAFQHSNVMRNSEELNVLDAEGEQIYILELQGLIFFGTANKLLTQIRDRIDHPTAIAVRFVILDFRLVSGLDASAVLSFAKLKQVATSKGVHLLFTDLSHEAMQRLKQGDCLEADDPFSHVFADLDRGLEWCEQQVLADSNLSELEARSLSDYLKSDFSDPIQVDRLMSRLEDRLFAEGDYLFHQGDPFDGLYFVGSGQVSVVLSLSEGQTKRIRTYTVGNTIGEMGLYRKTLRMASVIADKPSTVYFLSTEAFEQIEASDPLLASNIHRFVVNLLAERLQHREQELKNLLQSS